MLIYAMISNKGGLAKGHCKLIWINIGTYPAKVPRV